MTANKAASKSSTTSVKPAAERAVPVLATEPQAVTLAPVFAALRKRYPAARQAEVQAFAADLYRRMEEDEFPNHPPEQWAALASDMLEFTRVRKAGMVNVRVFNPTLKSHGYESPHTLLQIVNDDMPFLVDSVSMTLADLGIGVHVQGHPVLRIARDKGGKLTAVGEGKSESLMVLEIDRQPPEEMPKLEAAVRKVLAEVRAIVHDWAAMREKMVMLADDLATRRLPIDDISRHEAQELLRWAAADHFTFFGYREYRVEKQDGQDVLAPLEDTGLGLMRGHDTSPARPVTTLAAHGLNASSKLKDALILTKTNARSRVHRVGYMDYIGILEFDAKGRIVGEQRFLGLFTSSAYNCRPWEIPLVRQRHEYVMSKSGLAPSSHSGKALRHILETLPREELFQSNEEELYRTAIGILGLQERVRSRMFLRRDKYSRFISALVYIPRERFNTDVRLRIEGLLKDALHGEYIDSSVVLGESPLAQLHLIVRPKSGEALEFDTTELESRLAHLLRNWRDALREALVARHGEANGLRMAANFGRALPAGYIEDSSIESAVSDVEHLASLGGPDDLHLSLQEIRRDDGVRLDAGRGLRLKLYRQLDDIPLSDAMPMMENMGLRVISERPYRLQVGETPVYIQDFEVESTAGEINAAHADASFGEAFKRIWNGDAENDGFNRLILAAGLHWRQVALLRGYCKYLLQTAVPFSQAYVEATFTRYPLLARLLVELFEARFDPSTGSETKAQIFAGQERLREELSALAGGDDATLKALDTVLEARGGDRDAQHEATRATLLKLMDRVSSLDEDRILRSFMDVIDATLRTNYYQADKNGKHPHCISFKLDSARVPDLPKPRPYREIFVYGPRVEGVHLRFGAVARGGLRWSDRREDFRTEVLGLVKAQMVKNTVIVPVGAKGGFYVKRSPVGGGSTTENRDAIQAEGIACYKLFIQGLLDITDNIVGGKIVPPPQVVRHDHDDPYLVVAADKGTATFSDIANGLALDHGFWLGDAFASGGSVGYDHKGMGITARGAWESVKRHFRAMGRDCQSQDFSVVGIGDMSGDVFGNGMLLSKHIRLLAAFDHRHIFLDPNPDAAVSFAERDRLFKLPRSSWADYDAKLISAGGGIYPRTLKSIDISAPVREALGLDANVKQLSPNALMNAILKAPVDLFWNGGIGTYVKAASESHTDVGDRANNGLRVNGGELRCKVVGEGGNLGLTQLGRIEAAQTGVLLNTDFIDNSAGVDTSDHEVNIKILLNDMVQAKKLTYDARNTLLASMTDEVAELVLWDNYRQNQAISLMERMSVKRLGSKQHFIRTLELQGLLDRQIEFLPSDAELSARKARGQGLTRPELSVLLSYSKLVAFQQLLESDIPEDPYLSKELQRYFPQPLQKKYADAMERHRLKREIIATAVTNATINRMGATFLMRMQEDTGRSIGEVAKAYTISRETLDARALWTQIDALDGTVSEAVQIDALEVIWRLQRSFVRWLLLRPGQMPGITAAVERYHGPFNDIRVASGVLSHAQRPQYEASVQEWQDKGLTPALAQQLSELRYLEPAFDIIETARTRKLKPVDVSKVHFRLGEALRLPWLFEQIDALEVNGRWHAVARGVLRDELAAHQRALVGQALTMPGSSAEDKVANWLARDDSSLRFTLAMLTDVAEQKTFDYPTVSVAVQRLGQLAAHGL
ncbi:NAD-glutamate dehydrogenase [Xanthomonas oryzae]|uniref:NAD-glutamate dehydrogenase n=1 Tax=Xanthomonas oryzae pv. oryzae (strain PXO99A) TaxID=360094 RepID=A0A0K0GJN8_XANOP|nr:NAD-glutamate dehydrogenase domain-containing protein [Xanthomonas oryzae]ACD58482.1 NAD-glutamate dehydrogenase [Xanthomonas oryzae pv. oryzae PXO99A]AXM39715.1 NAD-glutamate dehydrogenase [Xanthomonas oryzae pv. oryzae]OLG31240.1 glutamate dehydrogenase [Xanthomonas oryzae pv. oryzae]OLG48289.1 glutamate dehydrogenase [Xanthomonas oryzae pv. oryzae]OLI53054.1 glutamate dehydrogenase [Xanthomonas oryzae pv. oryzae]